MSEIVCEDKTATDHLNCKGKKHTFVHSLCSSTRAPNLQKKNKKKKHPSPLLRREIRRGEENQPCNRGTEVKHLGKGMVSL